MSRRRSPRLAVTAGAPSESRAPLPRTILAIDWGARPAKRQLCRATLRDQRYTFEPPVRVERATALDLPAGALIAFDCPLGLPRPYTELAGLTSFRAALAGFGRERFARFYDVATAPAEIAIGRPFYPAPARGAGATRADMRPALGEAGLAPRVCDVRAGAGPLFWLVGPRQVGRSSIAVWRDVLAPRLDAIALWPFDGPLADLLASGRPVVAEMYPAHLARTLGLRVASKRSPRARAACGAALLASSAATGLDLDRVRRALRTGFGGAAAGEDPFDAVVACVALARLLLDGGIAEPPDEARSVEGWILGLAADQGAR